MTNIASNRDSTADYGPASAYGPGEALLDTVGAADFLRARGIPRSPSTLTRLRCVGGVAPPFRKIGRAVRYDPADLRKWIAEALSDPMRTTSNPLKGVIQS